MSRWNANDDDFVHVAITDAGCARPNPLNVRERWHVDSCLHAVGASFMYQSLGDAELNDLIDAIQSEKPEFPLESTETLLGKLKRLDWRTYIADVADMHGPMARGWYRETTLWVIDGLTEAARQKQARRIQYVRWGEPERQ